MDNNVKYYRHLISGQQYGHPNPLVNWEFTTRSGHELIQEKDSLESDRANSEENKPFIGTPEGYKITWWRLLLTHEITKQDYDAMYVNTIPLNQYIYYVNPA